MILETDRLYLRKLTLNDYGNLCKILQDKETMYAYEHAFSNDEVDQWLKNQLHRYDTLGYGLWAVMLKETDTFIGQCGLTLQDFRETLLLEVGYLFCKEYWHNGYATEAAIACKEYAFNTLHADKVYSIIRDNNISSQNVAKRNGMTPWDHMVKHYYDMDMPHTIFCVSKEGN